MHHTNEKAVVTNNLVKYKRPLTPSLLQVRQQIVTVWNLGTRMRRLLPQPIEPGKQNNNQDNPAVAAVEALAPKLLHLHLPPKNLHARPAAGGDQILKNVKDVLGGKQVLIRRIQQIGQTSISAG